MSTFRKLVVKEAVTSNVEEPVFFHSLSEYHFIEVNKIFERDISEDELLSLLNFLKHTVKWHGNNKSDDSLYTIVIDKDKLFDLNYVEESNLLRYMSIHNATNYDTGLNEFHFYKENPVVKYFKES